MEYTKTTGCNYIQELHGASISVDPKSPVHSSTELV